MGKYEPKPKRRVPNLDPLAGMTKIKMCYWIKKTRKYTDEYDYGYKYDEQTVYGPYEENELEAVKAHVEELNSKEEKWSQTTWSYYSKTQYSYMTTMWV